MRESSSIFRLLAALIVTAMSWAVVVPILHVACAMKPDVMSTICDPAHKTDAVVADDVEGHQPMGARGGAAVHHPSGVVVHQHEDAAPGNEVQESIPPFTEHGAMACCAVEASILDASATPAGVVDDTQRVSLSTIDAAQTTLAPVAAMRRADAPPEAPATPPFSLAFLSVFLI